MTQKLRCYISLDSLTESTPPSCTRTKQYQNAVHEQYKALLTKQTNKKTSFEWHQHVIFLLLTKYSLSLVFYYAAKILTTEEYSVLYSSVWR